MLFLNRKMMEWVENEDARGIYVVKTVNGQTHFEPHTHQLK